MLCNAVLTDAMLDDAMLNDAMLNDAMLDDFMLNVSVLGDAVLNDAVNDADMPRMLSSADVSVKSLFSLVSGFSTGIPSRQPCSDRVFNVGV